MNEMPKHISFPMYFRGQRWGQLLIPDDLSREDFDLLSQQLDNHCETIEAVLLQPDAPPETQDDQPS